METTLQHAFHIHMLICTQVGNWHFSQVTNTLYTVLQNVIMKQQKHLTLIIFGTQ